MGNPAPVQRLYRFGEFTLDAHTGELARNGNRTPLREQPLQLLLALLERPGELVSREDLIGRLWEPNTFVDFDRGLNKAVNHLREALGDSAEHPQFIETLPRKGYRFVGQLVEESPSLEPAAPASQRQGSTHHLWIAAPGDPGAGCDNSNCKSGRPSDPHREPTATGPSANLLHCRHSAGEPLGRSRPGIFRRRADG